MDSDTQLRIRATQLARSLAVFPEPQELLEGARLIADFLDRTGGNKSHAKELQDLALASVAMFDRDDRPWPALIADAEKVWAFLAGQPIASPAAPSEAPALPTGGL